MPVLVTLLVFTISVTFTHANSALSPRLKVTDEGKKVTGSFCESVHMANRSSGQVNFKINL